MPDTTSGRQQDSISAPASTLGAMSNSYYALPASQHQHSHSHPHSYPQAAPTHSHSHSHSHSPHPRPHPPTTPAPAPSTDPSPSTDDPKSTDYGLGFDLSALSAEDQAVIVMAWTAQQKRDSGCVVAVSARRRRRG